MTTATLITFAIACFFIVIVPGPTLTVIIANSLRRGMSAGLANVAGTQLGVLVMMLVVAFSLNTVVLFMAEAFFWLKIAGAAYLIWLGIKLWRADGDALSINEDKPLKEPKSGYFWQGFFVICSNPKALFLFGAIIPQFIDPGQDAFWQVMALGTVFMVVATICDTLYAFLAGKAGAMLTKNRVNAVEKTSGAFLIGGGLWMATLQKS